MAQELVTDLSVILPSVFLTVMLMHFVLTDAYIGRNHRKVLLMICVMMLGLIAQNYSDMLLQERYVNVPLRTAVAILGYILRPVILVLFCYVVNPGGRFRAVWALAAINGIIYLTAVFSRLTFWINEANHYQEGPLRYTCHIISAVLLFYLLFLSVRRFRATGTRDNWVPLISVLLILGSIILDSTVGNSLQPVTFLTVAIVLNSSFYYIWLHLQFVREHEEALRADQRIQIMMSQIQPHFLFNTLTAIRSLCRTDPEKAEQLTTLFSNYLRQNLDSLETNELIPLKKELEHVRIYAEIELTRFPNIRVEYDIRDEGFSGPALMVQPLVENAIRHGVRIREDGLVEVATRRAAGGHEILIRDNGAGFDAGKISAGSGTHIGIRNVTERVEKMCRGTVTISSRPGEGTEIVIFIPADQPETGRREDQQ